MAKPNPNLTYTVNPNLTQPKPTSVSPWLLRSSHGFQW